MGTSSINGAAAPPPAHISCDDARIGGWCGAREARDVRGGDGIKAQCHPAEEVLGPRRRVLPKLPAQVGRG
eukprot:CAMPEP_0119378452 /NCGR_PEP_ID=MMETSP1334-20130426/48369_1 /TAXON_ID=127549 /ORGANISM="Calcidiscus leptoporus, Strain RCC1130" /LENGTH=70 /DNA_ID=CAMNT_0007397657 /DNA_START=261 /DNA_END=469 /DNA_ORIENTATION=-